MIILLILTASIRHFSLKGWESELLNLGVKGLKRKNEKKGRRPAPTEQIEAEKK